MREPAVGQIPEPNRLVPRNRHHLLRLIPAGKSYLPGEVDSRGKHRLGVPALPRGLRAGRQEAGESRAEAEAGLGFPRERTAVKAALDVETAGEEGKKTPTDGGSRRGSPRPRFPRCSPRRTRWRNSRGSARRRGAGGFCRRGFGPSNATCTYPSTGKRGNPHAGRTLVARDHVRPVLFPPFRVCEARDPR